MSAAVARGYPTAHRPAAAGYSPPGFQRGAPPVPKPANDNRPPPANDNNKPLKAAQTALRGLGKVARLHPYVRGLGLALDLYDLYRAYQGQAAQPGGWNLAGWSVDCQVGPLNYLFGGAVSCGRTASQPKTTEGTIFDGGGAWFINFWQTRIPAGLPNYWQGVVSARYRQNKVGPVPPPVPELGPEIPALPPIWQTPAVPEVAPAIDPMALPIGQPVPVPQPLPWRVIPARRTNPWRSPSEQTQRGPVTRAPARAVGPTIEIGPNGTRSIRPQHRRARPPEGTKERKFAANIRLGLNLATDAVTETKDAVEAIHDALPARFQAPKNGNLDAGLQDMMFALWDHFDQIDMAKAIENLIKNQVEDAIIGRANRATRALDRTIGHGVNRPGSGFGPAL
nr:MAG: hypothetical protein [Microvirus sp.]